MAAASRDAEFVRGEARLFASVNDPELPSLGVDPRPSQTKATALVVVNLQAGLPRAPQRDERSRFEVPLPQKAAGDESLDTEIFP